MSDATEGQDLAPKAPMDEQLTVNNPALSLGRKQRAKAKQGEKVATEARTSESSDDDEDGGVKISNEHLQLSTATQDKKLVVTASGPAPEKENKQPLKSILKKTVGTKAEARQAEARQAEARQTAAEGSSSGQVLEGEHEDNNGGGIKLFQGAAERLKASKDDVDESVPEEQGGAPIPKLVLDTDTGLVAARTNSNGEPVFDSSAPGDGDGSPSGAGSPCKGCALM